MSQKRSRVSRARRLEVATLGGGCFWCLEAVFDESKGVVKVESGYSGGTLEYLTCEPVSTGTTGPAEVVQITFNPRIISFKEILEIFFTVHDPTTLNRQGSDVGHQYRSVIFYHSTEQKIIAQLVIDKLGSAKIWDAPIVTQIEPFRSFCKAEDYHKQYFKRRPEQPYCRLIIAPKIVKLREHYRNKFINKLLNCVVRT